MTATSHALVGAMIAAKFSNPYIALPVCLISHIVLDYIPHWDAGIGWRKKHKKTLFSESVVDVLIGVVLSLLLYGGVLHQTNYLYMFICMFMAQLPDWLMAPYLILSNNNPVFKMAYNFGKCTNNMTTLGWGITTQVTTVGGLYLLLFRVF